MLTPLHKVACDVPGLGVPRQRESILRAFNSFFFNFFYITNRAMLQTELIAFFLKFLKKKTNLSIYCL